MQTTIDLDDNLLIEAQRITGVKEQELLINAGLRALIGSDEAQRFLCMGASERSQRKTRTPGSARGLLKINFEDDEHLEDFQEYMS